MSTDATARVQTQRWCDGVVTGAPDELIVEEPLTILLDGVMVATTMRTPGHDAELATGWCFTEGLLGGAEVLDCRHCRSVAPTQTVERAEVERAEVERSAGSEVLPHTTVDPNTVVVDTGAMAPPPQPRLGMTSSSCGLCGTAAIEDLATRLSPLTDPVSVDPAVLLAVAHSVRAVQPLFDATGAVHAAAAFDPSGTVLVVREDIGRHNAVDKVVGSLLARTSGSGSSLPGAGLGLYVSGRASFEMVAKAWAAGFSALVSVSAPSALAVETARHAGLTMAGFVRGDQMNLYSPAATP
jgi:FdhD protein